MQVSSLKLDHSSIFLTVCTLSLHNLQFFCSNLFDIFITCNFWRETAQSVDKGGIAHNINWLLSFCIKTEVNFRLYSVYFYYYASKK